MRKNHDTHLATDTFFMVLNDYAIRPFGIGVSRADFQTLRIITMITNIVINAWAFGESSLNSRTRRHKTPGG